MKCGAVETERRTQQVQRQKTLDDRNMETAMFIAHFIMDILQGTVRKASSDDLRRRLQSSNLLFDVRIFSIRVKPSVWTFCLPLLAVRKLQKGCWWVHDAIRLHTPRCCSFLCRYSCSPPSALANQSMLVDVKRITAVAPAQEVTSFFLLWWQNHPISANQ